MKTEFEEFAEMNNLSLEKYPYSDEYRVYTTFYTKRAWDTQQAKIDKLEHDLGNEKCANRMLQHVLDKEVKS